MKVAGFHRSTGSAFFARLNGPYDVYHVLLGVQGVGTGGDDLLGNFFTKLVVQLENDSNEGRSQAIRRYFHNG